MPENRELDGLQLADALRAGIYRLFAQTDHINKINVFPVPDGDTGTNMSMTLSAVLVALDREPQVHAGLLLVRAADAALDGARGNSGAILAQFLLGLGDGAGHQARLRLDDFVTAVGQGARYARDALSQPREGTLLTILQAFAQASERLLPQALSFQALFEQALVTVRQSLDGTRQQLDELRAANVVDAGALGFVEVLEGMRHFLLTGELGETAAPVHGGDEMMAGGGGVAADQDFRFCTECLVTAPESATLDLRQLREELSSLGASLVVSGSKRKAKIHVHVDDPEGIFRLASRFGSVSGHKADDMQRQQDAAHHGRLQRVAVAVDSGADIPEALAERYGIHMIPVRIHFGTRSYLDKVSLTPSEFYRELAVNPQHPKTSQPPPGDFRRMFEFLVSHYDEVFSINLTSRHSGTFDAASAAAQRVSAEGKTVTVIDSLNASVGQGLIALAVAEAAAQGADAATLARVTREAVAHTRTFALLKDIRFAVRGGRVPALVGRIARALRLNVILRTHPDGRIAAGGGLWGRSRLRERFAGFVARRVVEDAQRGPLRLLIGHGDELDEAQRFADDLRSRLPTESIEWIEITDMSPAVGVHGGPGTLIVAVQSAINVRAQ